MASSDEPPGSAKASDPPSAPVAAAAIDPPAAPVAAAASDPPSAPVAAAASDPPAAPLDPTAPGPAAGPAPAPPRRRRRWRWILARIVEGGVLLAGLGTLLLWCSVPNTARLADENPTSTAFIDLRRDQAEDAGKRFDLKWEWRPLGRISRYLRAAVIYAEDYRFYRHDGVDWGAIGDAVAANWDRGSFAIGGSTITQQLAKNLYLSPSRSILRKAREMMIAFALEDHLSKQRILELYLNVVEWGDGVFGAEAAAQRWFGHSAMALTPAEAARLAIALPNPIQRAPNVRTPMLIRRAVRIVHLLRMQGLIDAAQERTALDQVGAPDEPVLQSRRRAPALPPTTTAPPPAPPPDDAPAPASPPDPAGPAPDPAPAPAPAPAPTDEPPPAPAP